LSPSDDSAKEARRFSRADLAPLPDAEFRILLARILRERADATGDRIVGHAARYLDGMIARDKYAERDAFLLAELDRLTGLVGRRRAMAELVTAEGLDEADQRRLRRKRTTPVSVLESSSQMENDKHEAENRAARPGGRRAQKQILDCRPHRRARRAR
jgi:hypothetical protein